jgi:hypothetical protein
VRQIAIVGGGKSWIRAPFGDPSWEVWAHSSCFEGMEARGVDRWFDVHRPAVRAGVKSWSQRYRRWLTDPTEGRTAPVYVLDGFTPAQKPDPIFHIPTIENDEIFDHRVIPWRNLQQWLMARGATQQEYVTSTGAWMLKLALFEGADTIGVWGIDYEEEGEYLVQRPCMEHWIGFARGLGVNVYVTAGSNLGRDGHVYGFDGYRPDLVHTFKPYRKNAQRITVLQALGKEPMHEIPREIQQLIEEEKSRFGIDTAAEWAKAARFR